MNNHKLIIESWRDFLGPMLGTEKIKFDDNHDNFYYKEPYLASSKDNITSTDNLVKIIVDHPVAEHFMVRPGTMGHQGKFYNWKKFKTLNSKVEEITKQRDEAKRKKRQSREEQIKKTLGQATSESKLALAIINKDYLDALVLYQPTVIERDGRPRIIGMITVGETTGPCIPNTLQVRFSAVATKFQKSGFGTILYRLAAAHAKKTENGGGITSDHESSTSNSARRRWIAIDSDPDFYKRTTSKGNSVFDYDGKKTPDDNEDNCSDSTGNAAAPHSYGVSDSVLQIYEDLHAADIIYNKDNFLYRNDEFHKKAFGVFDRSYREANR